MGESVSFPSNGDTASGYLSVPDAGQGPGLLVLQEWWGLVPQIKRTADWLATKGFVALAPDLYHGHIAEHTEMDKAQQLMESMPPDRAARDMSAAIDYLLAHKSVIGRSVGVIGFCMGGMLTLMISAFQGDRIRAAVPFYGAPLGELAPDWSGLTATVQGHFAEDDQMFPIEPIRQLEAELKRSGKDVDFIVHPNVGHAFANDENPLGTFDATTATTALEEAVKFLAEKLA